MCHDMACRYFTLLFSAAMLISCSTTPQRAETGWTGEPSVELRPSVALVNRIDAGTRFAETKLDAPIQWSGNATVKMDLGKATDRALPRIAKGSHVPFPKHEPRDARPDLLIVLSDVASTSAQTTKITADYHVSLQYEVRCYDRHGLLLQTTTVSGEGTAKQSALVEWGGLLFEMATLGISARGEYQISFNKAVMNAVTDGLRNLAEDASRLSWVNEVLVADVKGEEIHAITNRAVDFFQKKDYVRAYLYLEEAQRQDRTYQPAACYMGACLAYLDRHDDAISTLREAIALNPQSEEAQRAQLWLQRIEKLQLPNDTVRPDGRSRAKRDRGLQEIPSS